MAASRRFRRFSAEVHVVSFPLKHLVSSVTKVFQSAGTIAFQARKLSRRGSRFDDLRIVANLSIRTVPSLRLRIRVYRWISRHSQCRCNCDLHQIVAANICCRAFWMSQWAGRFSWRYCRGIATSLLPGTGTAAFNWQRLEKLYGSESWWRSEKR